MNEFNWKGAFFNLDVSKILSVCNATIKNEMATFIPHGTVICDVNPPWINNRIKKINS